MLRRIELRGFKSFASPVTLDLGPGVNVIVGPNGSGKSNLAEAIVWAMGEQRPGRLRAGGMGEVVFSGGEGRPAAGLAEVRITLADDGAEAGRPAEVEVTRRVTRTGDAAYRLNGSGCRLLDVHESLGALGLGPDALAVIRQGQVEAVCAARPADLRAVLEEAAGVALSRRRRRRAEGKLGRVHDRLARARDLVAELTQRAATLERQARAAERALELEAGIESARRRVAAAGAVAAARALAAAEAARAAAARDRDAALAALAAARTALGAAERDAAAREGARDAALDLVRTLRAAAERVASRAELGGERLDGARRARTRAEAERTAALDAHGEAARDAEAARGRQAAAAAAAAAAEARLHSAREAHRVASEAAREARRLADDAAAARDDAARAATAAAARVARADAAHEQAERRVAAVVAASGLHDTARAERRAEVAALRRERWDARRAAGEERRRDAESARGAAEARRREAAAEAARLAPAAGHTASGLGAGLEVEPGAERAVGAALGVLADAALTAGLDAAAAAVGGGAPAALLPAPARPAPPGPPGARPLLEVVRACAPEARPHLARVLAEVWLVDDLATVPAGHPGLFVTSDGRALRPAQGALTRPGSGWAREALHRAAVARLGEAEEAASAARRAAEAESAALAALARRVRAAERSAATAATALAAARAAESRAADELGAARGGLEAAARERADARESQAPAAAARGEAEGAALRAGAAARGTTERLEAVARDLRQAETDAAALRAELAAAGVAVGETAERLAALESRAATPPPAVDLGAAARAVQALGDTAEALERAAARTGAAAQATEAALQEAARTRGDARRAAGRAEEALREASARLHAAELEHAAAHARAEEHGPPAEDPGEVDPEAERVRMEDLERRRRAIGAVNPLAAEERDAIGERIAEITEQAEDLQRAADALAGHMEGLDTAVTDGFEELFATVRGHFSQVVEMLFPGGQGRLVEVASEDGEAGVEVQVVPAGKRPRPLALMSGGERSLVALAFCVSIAMARPAPFYLLDEVEAALDDTNLRRFLAVVRRLADHTQFVLITHQQPTVEIADTLFGVTMGGDGASQVVSRRLDAGLGAQASRPFVRRQLRAIQGGRA